jgi:hypothetical protein
MHTVWDWIGEAATVASELLIGDASPMRTLTALTLFNNNKVYAIHRTVAPRQLITLWAIGSSSLILWTACAAMLHYAGVA